MDLKQRAGPTGLTVVLCPVIVSVLVQQAVFSSTISCDALWYEWLRVNGVLFKCLLIKKKKTAAGRNNLNNAKSCSLVINFRHSGIILLKLRAC